MNKITILFISILLFISCKQTENNGLQFVSRDRDVPTFSADSAYYFIETQVNFSPRVPNTYGHAETREYLMAKLKDYAGDQSVFPQEFTAEGYSGDMKLTNIIAAFNTSATDRIMLCAHWDTRPRADMDTVKTADYIPGADDGGSGVGILLELARLMADNPPPVGVDIVLFDGEDYGTSGDIKKYFIGSRYWAQNPPVPGYKPRFGILLDMVGAKGAQFPKEEYSMMYAPNLVNELWGIAEDKGYGHLFLNEPGAGVLDDHYIIDQYTDIPVIDVINHSRGEDGNIVFAEHWHTHRDDMPVISKETLKAVGEVLAELIYNRI
tara:strand:- start:280055 stop:281020 length:966 start_codon:yes stop_codon:yes gene_type:complete